MEHTSLVLEEKREQASYFTNGSVGSKLALVNNNLIILSKTLWTEEVLQQNLFSEIAFDRNKKRFCIKF